MSRRFLIGLVCGSIVVWSAAILMGLSAAVLHWPIRDEPASMAPVAA